MVAIALNKRKSVHKRSKKFTRCEYEDYPGKLKPSWRKPHGIDNTVRRRLRGVKPLVTIGWGTNKKTRYTEKNGFRRFLIKTPADIELLLMNNRTFSGELAANLSAGKRAICIKRAKELNVNLTNAK